MSETDLVRAIMQALALDSDVLVLRINSGTRVIEGKHKRRVFRGAPAGTSDLLLCVRSTVGWGEDRDGAVRHEDGRFAALEVKTAKGRTTPKQEAFLADVRRRGGFACVVRSVDEARAAVARCKSGAMS